MLKMPLEIMSWTRIKEHGWIVDQAMGSKGITQLDTALAGGFLLDYPFKQRVHPGCIS